MADRVDWTNAIKRAGQVKVFQVITEQGFMDVRNLPKNTNFTSKVKEFHEKYSKHVKEAADQSV